MKHDPPARFHGHLLHLLNQEILYHSGELGLHYTGPHGITLRYSGTYETRSSSQILRASPATPEPASSLPSQIILDPFQATPLANVTPQEAPVLLTQEVEHTVYMVR